MESQISLTLLSLCEELSCQWGRKWFWCQIKLNSVAQSCIGKGGAGPEHKIDANFNKKRKLWAKNAMH